MSSGGGSGSGGTPSGGAGGTVATAACADGTDDQVYGADMVGCDGASNQCLAETLCAAGWHLCPFSEYVVRGGKTTKASAERWLRSCVRESADAKGKCPGELVCANDCATSTLVTAPLSWDCAGKVLESPPETGIGVTTSPTSPLMRPGCATAECAYVRLTAASYGANTGDPVGATCCKD